MLSAAGRHNSPRRAAGGRIPPVAGHLCSRVDGAVRWTTEVRRRSVGKGKSDGTLPQLAVNRVDGEGGLGEVKCEENRRELEK